MFFGLYAVAHSDFRFLRSTITLLMGRRIPAANEHDTDLAQVLAGRLRQCKTRCAVAGLIVLCYGASLGYTLLAAWLALYLIPLP